MSQVSKPRTPCSGVTDFQMLVPFTLQANSETCLRDGKILAAVLATTSGGVKAGESHSDCDHDLSLNFEVQLT